MLRKVIELTIAMLAKEKWVVVVIVLIIHHRRRWIPWIVLHFGMGNDGMLFHGGNDGSS